MPEDLTSKIDWLGHASFRVRGTRIIYIDPWKIQGAPHDGDLVLVTHSHYDHLSMEDIAKVIKTGGTLVAPRSDEDKITWDPLVLLAPDEKTSLLDVGIEAVPAYNTNKDFHPVSQGWVGYVIEIDGLRLYHSGDTDIIDEMHSICCDVALLPVSGTYVMTASEAVEAACRIGPKVVIPMHWGEIVGVKADAELLASRCACPVEIRKPVQ